MSRHRPRKAIRITVKLRDRQGGKPPADGLSIQRGVNMKKILTSLAVVSLLGGCASAYHPVPFDHATSGVSSLQLINNDMPAQSSVRKLATNGQNIASGASGAGLAGLFVVVAVAGVEGSIASDQNKKINTALATQNFDGKAIFNDALLADLHDQKYDTSITHISRDEDHNLVDLNPQPQAPAGTAVLNVDGYGYGYQQVGGVKNWRPYVILAVKMYDAKQPTKVLLDNRVEYNAVVPSALTVNIPADDTYSFDSIEAIQANPAKAAEGLKAALVASAHATAKLMR
jgi:hypothetical protein